MNPGQPIPCTDDTGESGSFQTGQSVHASDFGGSQEQGAARQDLTTDAAPQPDYRAPPQAASAGQRGRTGQKPDTYKITGPHGTIEASDILGALGPDTNFQFGLVNNMTVYEGEQPSSTMPTAPRKNKLPVTENSASPSSDHLMTVAKGIAREWRRLGRALHLEEPSLEQIYIDYIKEGQVEVNYQVLRKWKETCRTASIHTLAVALIKVERGDLADFLSRLK